MEIRRRAVGRSTLLVGVDGCGGAGKSVFSERLSQHLVDAQVIHTDDFASWNEPIEWWPRFNEQVIRPLARGDSARWQRYDWDLGELAEWHTTECSATVIIEGVGATRSEWRAELAYRVWVDCPRQLRLERGLARDGEGALPLWRRWMVAEDRYVADQRPRDHADLIVDGAIEVAPREEWFVRIP